MGLHSYLNTEFKLYFFIKVQEMRYCSLAEAKVLSTHTQVKHLFKYVQLLLKQNVKVCTISIQAKCKKFIRATYARLKVLLTPVNLTILSPFRIAFHGNMIFLPNISWQEGTTTRYRNDTPSFTELT